MKILNDIKWKLLARRYGKHMSTLSPSETFSSLISLLTVFASFFFVVKFLESLGRAYVKEKMREIMMDRDAELKYLGKFKYIELAIRRIKATSIYKKLHKVFGETWMFRFAKNVYKNMKRRILYKGLLKKAGEWICT